MKAEPPALRRTNGNSRNNLREDIDDVPSVQQIADELMLLFDFLNDPNLTESERVARQAHFTDHVISAGFLATDAADIGISTAQTINKVGIKAFHSTK